MRRLWGGGANARTVAIDAALIPCDGFLRQAEVCSRPDRPVGRWPPRPPGVYQRRIGIRKFGKRASGPAGSARNQAEIGGNSGTVSGTATAHDAHLIGRTYRFFE